MWKQWKLSNKFRMDLEDYICVAAMKAGHGTLLTEEDYG